MVTVVVQMPDGQTLTATTPVTAALDPRSMARHGIVAAARTVEDLADGWADSRGRSRHAIPPSEVEALPQRLSTAPPGTPWVASGVPRNMSGSYLTSAPTRDGGSTQAWPQQPGR